MPATDSYLRNLSKVHVVFCASAVAFAVATLLILYKDHNDEWRQYQSDFDRIRATRSAIELAGAEELAVGGTVEEFNRTAQELRDGIEAAQKALESGTDDYAQLTETLETAARTYDLTGRSVRDVRARRDVARANLDLAVRDEESADVIKARQIAFDDLQDEVDRLEQQWEIDEEGMRAAQKALDAVTADRDSAEDELKKLTSESTRIGEVLDTIAPDKWWKSAKRSFMEWPIVDGFNSHRRVVQDWLPELQIRLGMTQTARFDRCRTCHLGIDNFETGNLPSFPFGHPESADPAEWVLEDKFPHPFASHPRPDVYLTATSPHPLADFGCTSCHDGQGSATSFLNAQHGPNDPAQDHEWSEKYGHYHNHFWEYPMLPERLREAACLKCHHDVIELGVNPDFGATAPKAYAGWQLIRKYGCFGCHEINGFDGGKRIGPDLRAEPNEEEAAAYAADPNMVPGQLRRVGPSLKHVAQKSSADWISYWTEDPARFRPTTGMPKFFGLTNLDDHDGIELSQVEIVAIGRFLHHQSTDIELDPIPAGFKPDAERGKVALAERGCLACHTHDDEFFKGSDSTFGPNLTRTGEKLLDRDRGREWLYTWIRNPQKYHPRSRMPNLFIEPQVDADGNVISDPAADIAEFLIANGPKEWDTYQPVPERVRELTRMYLAGKSLTNAEFDQFWSSRQFPLAESDIKGDEIELVFKGDGVPNDEEWNTLLMNYLGRRSVSRYGCYACHEINGFGTARPIGTTLQDWGRKDPSRLAPEHIHEYLHHHGEPDGSSTAALVEAALEKAENGGFDSEEQKDEQLRKAFFYDSLIHHGRPGFIFQKLRAPRSYDYMKTSTKTYIERLVMPKFPLQEEEMEQIATFVLGLVADPPAGKYVYQPSQEHNDRNQGEILLQKYNCVGCHVIDLPSIEYALGEGELAAYTPRDTDNAGGLSGFLNWRSPASALTGRTVDFQGETLPVVRLKGMVNVPPNPEDDPADQFLAFDLWESVHQLPAEEVDRRIVAVNRGEREAILDVEEVTFPGRVVVTPATRVVAQNPARGGQFAEWLVDYIGREKSGVNLYGAWQMSPPPLFKEGDKVQTNWLFKFLKDPEQLRHTTLLRMPQFNMSDAEARTLANYFAAADGVPYPYQAIPQGEPEYLAASQARFSTEFPDRAAEHGYLRESWDLLNGQLCIKCHAVGGMPFMTAPGPGVIRGPDLSYVNERLRPDWTLMWLYNPQWITPYTSMPAPFPKNQEQFKPLFHGNSEAQTIGVRDALMNYHQLMEMTRPATAQATAVDAASAKEE